MEKPWRRGNMTPMKCSLAYLVFGACLNLCLRAENITLTPVADTSIFEKLPQNNLGRVNTLAVGGNASTGPGAAADRSRALLRFDVSGIPAGAKIEQATVSVNVSKVPSLPPSATFALHRMLQSWVEGTTSGSNAGALAHPGEATWNTPGPGSWGSPGGQAGTDYIDLESSTVTMNGIGNYTFPSTPELLADIKAWVDAGAQNFGWMIICEEETTIETAKRMDSKEASTAANRPTLSITYSLLVADLRLTGITVLNGNVHLTWAGGSPFYRVQRKTSLAAGQWENVSSIMPDTSADVAMSGEAAFFRVEGSLIPPP
jgi:hypothetical protein